MQRDEKKLGYAERKKKRNQSIREGKKKHKETNESTKKWVEITRTLL